MLLRSVIISIAAASLMFAGCPEEVTNPLGDLAGTDTGTDNGGTDNGGTDNGGTDNGGTDNGGTDNGGTDNGGTDNGGTDTGGTDTGGTDNGGTDNAPGDVGTDTGPQGIQFCFEIEGCLLDNCAPSDTACLNAAAQGVCNPPNIAEGQAFQASQICQQTNCSQFASNPAMALQCRLDECADEDAACRSGGTFGSGTCAALIQCAAACSQSGAGTQCQRDCYAAATLEAVVGLISIDICISIACQATPTQACIQGAIGPGGACEAEVTACQTGITPPPDTGTDTGGTDTGGGDVSTEIGPPAMMNGCMTDGSDSTDMTGNAAVTLTDTAAWTIPHQACMRVSANTAVTWDGNFGAHPLGGGETPTVDNGSPITGSDQSGSSATVTFDTPGLYPYFCTIHNGSMQGLIIVE